MPSSKGRRYRHASRTDSATTYQGVALNPFTRLSRHRDNHERGATLILVAISMTALIAASGMAVDLGRTFVTNRSLQLVADDAALDSARYIAAQETLTLPSSTSNLVVEADHCRHQQRLRGQPQRDRRPVDESDVHPGIGRPLQGYRPRHRATFRATPYKVTATSNLARLFSHGTSTLKPNGRGGRHTRSVILDWQLSRLDSDSSPQTSVLGVLLGNAWCVGQSDRGGVLPDWPTPS